MGVTAWVFTVVFIAAGIVAVILEGNWPTALVLVGIGLFPFFSSRM